MMVSENSDFCSLGFEIKGIGLVLDETVGQRILRLFETRRRKERDDGFQFRKEDLADEVGVPLHELTVWIKGRAEPDTDQTARLATALDVSVQYVQTGESGRTLDLRGLNRPDLADESVWVFWTMGQLLWKLQLVEGAVAQTGVALFDGYHGMGVEKAQLQLAKRGKETFGRNIRRITNRLSLSEETSGSLRELVEERNWFVHESHGDHGKDIRPSGSPGKLIDRLDRLDKLADQVLADLTRALGAYVLAHDIDPRTVEEEARRRLSS